MTVKEFLFKDRDFSIFKLVPDIPVRCIVIFLLIAIIVAFTFPNFVDGVVEIAENKGNQYWQEISSGSGRWEIQKNLAQKKADEMEKKRKEKFPIIKNLSNVVCFSYFCPPKGTQLLWVIVERKDSQILLFFENNQLVKEIELIIDFLPSQIVFSDKNLGIVFREGKPVIKTEDAGNTWKEIESTL